MSSTAAKLLACGVIGQVLRLCASIPHMSGDESITLSDEKKLIKKLLGNYKKAGIIGRPVQNTSDKVVVEYGLGLIQILDLDEKNQILTINVWSRYTWTDQLLQWDPRNFSDVKEVRVPPDKIWTPDIVLYNYADERMKEQREVMVVVDFNGKVIWIPPAIYKSTCKIDIKNFPFDQQACHLKFGSWTYDGFKLDIQFYENKSEVNTDDYTPSNEWQIVSRPARRNVKTYPCCPEPYPDLTFFLFLRRNPAFFAYLLVLPCVLLSSLTLVIFWLPPESPAKMVLGMNIFVAFFLLLLLLADSTPSASTSVPYIGYYYCLNMVLITLSTFLSVIVINLYFRGDKRNRLPINIKKGVNFLAGILCMQHEVTQDDSEKLRVIKSEIKHNLHHKEKQAARKHRTPAANVELRTMNTGRVPGPGPDELHHVVIPLPNPGEAYMGPVYNMPPPQMTANMEKSPFTEANQTLENDLREIRRAIRNLMTRLAEKDATNRIAREWRMVALVLDRIFFWFYLIVIIVAGLALLLPKEPTQSQEQVIYENTPKQISPTSTDAPTPDPLQY